MTAPDSSGPDDRPEWLAGYADGELDEAQRGEVETRLADDAEAAETLRDQEQFSPANRDLWDAVAPPDPSPAAWVAVNARVAAASLPPVRRPAWRLWAVRAAGVAAAVALGWLAIRGTHAPAPPGSVIPDADPADPLAGFAVLPIADPAEVDIEAVRGGPPDRFVVADDPVPDTLVLAGPGDVILEAMADPTAVPTAPGDNPMVFARPR